MATIFGFLYMGCTLAPPEKIRLNRPCAAAMQPYVKLLWPLVVVSGENSSIALQGAILICWNSSGKNTKVASFLSHIFWATLYTKIAILVAIFRLLLCCVSWRSASALDISNHLQSRWLHNGVLAGVLRTRHRGVTLFYTVSQKKGATLTMAVTLSILDGFAKCFHCCKEQ